MYCIIPTVSLFHLIFYSSLRYSILLCNEISPHFSVYERRTPAVNCTARRLFEWVWGALAYVRCVLPLSWRIVATRLFHPILRDFRNDLSPLFSSFVKWLISLPLTGRSWYRKHLLFKKFTNVKCPMLNSDLKNLTIDINRLKFSLFTPVASLA